jgi:hypothetical protein
MPLLALADPLSDDLLKRSSVAGTLELACQNLDLTDTQYQRAISSYEAVGRWIAAADDVRLRTANVYPQGSISIQTANRPLRDGEFDVDSVSHLPLLTTDVAPLVVKRLIGDRLRQNAYYASILSEKPRCWRLNYKGEFHLDLTPSILNPLCLQGGELVPDRDLSCWKESNPKGQRALFERRAALAPRLHLSKAEFAAARASIEHLPYPSRLKGVLRRLVQILKRSRDVAFLANAELAPISVIITTLAARSYEFCVLNHEHDTELDVVVDVIDLMPQFIERRLEFGRTMYVISNETTRNENFAEKWNAKPALANAFFEWHQRVRALLGQLIAAVGIDSVAKSMGTLVGEAVGDGVRQRMVAAVSSARKDGLLTVAPKAGVALGAGVAVKRNTFYGR